MEKLLIRFGPGSGQTSIACLAGNGVEAFLKASLSTGTVALEEDWRRSARQICCYYTPSD